jgi:hypothetical protein
LSESVSSFTAHPGESRDPGLTVKLVPDCSFKPVQGAQPFLDSGFRRNERNKVICLR